MTTQQVKTDYHCTWITSCMCSLSPVNNDLGILWYSFIRPHLVFYSSHLWGKPQVPTLVPLSSKQWVAVMSIMDCYPQLKKKWGKKQSYKKFKFPPLNSSPVCLHGGMYVDTAQTMDVFVKKKNLNWIFLCHFLARHYTECLKWVQLMLMPPSSSRIGRLKMRSLYVLYWRLPSI